MFARASIGTTARVLAVLAAAASLTACDVVISSIDAKGRATDSWTKSFELAPTGEVQIDNNIGGIEVTGGPGTQVEVTAERTARGVTDQDAKKLLGQVKVVEESSPAKLRLEMKAPEGEAGHLEVKYHVKVPSGAIVRLRTSNGEVSVAQVSGDVSAGSTNGSVRGRELGGAVEASTTNGTVRLQMTAVAAGGIKADTVNGVVELSIPASARATVDASCVNGHIAIDGMKLEGPEPTRRQVSGRLNGGGPKIALDTVNGAIRITGK